MIVTTDGNIPSRYAHSINVVKMANGFYQAGQSVELVTLLSLPIIKEIVKIRNIHRYYGLNNVIP